jgi:signal transduction histidine kinase
VPPGVEIFTDPTALEIVIKNVFDNAVKYSGETPLVLVEMRQLDSGHLSITVQDHGIGINRNQLKRIFKRFHRAPDAKVNERSGSGLGLYVAHRLLRNLGGRIRAESEGPSRGTTMRIRLPKP